MISEIFEKVPRNSDEVMIRNQMSLSDPQVFRIRNPPGPPSISQRITQ